MYIFLFYLVINKNTMTQKHNLQHHKTRKKQNETHFEKTHVSKSVVANVISKCLRINFAAQLIV